MNLIWDCFSAFARKRPEGVAIRCCGESFSYSRVTAESERLAAVFCKSIPEGSHVAVYLPNNRSFPISFLALARNGMVMMPLNLKYRASELNHYLSCLPISAILTDRKNLEQLSTIQSIPEIIFVWEDILDDNHVESCAVSEVPVDNPAVVQFSSGSTGLPKTIHRSHLNLITEVKQLTEALKISQADTFLGLLPLYHAHGFSNAMMAALLNGGQLVLKEGFNPRTAIKLLEEENITCFPAVPFMIKLMSETHFTGKINWSGLRFCFTAGAALDEETAVAFRKRFGITVRQLYGSTETGAIALNLNDPIGKTGKSVGAPLGKAEVIVFDENMNPCGNGQTGEIGINSPTMATCYSKMPKETKESFRKGYFFPGDLGYFDSAGNLYITGRKSLFINVGGNKINPYEVEKVIASIPEVKDVVVFGVPLAQGSGELVKAFVVMEGPNNKELILDYCCNNLAETKIPKVIDFISEIPRSVTGKVLKKYLI